MATKSSGALLNKRPKYNEAFETEALFLALESLSTQGAARPLGIYPNTVGRN